MNQKENIAVSGRWLRLAALIALAALPVIFLSGCINTLPQAANCANAGGGDFNVSICYQTEAVRIAVFNASASAPQDALAQCLNIDKYDKDVEASCIQSVAKITKDQSLCDSMPASSFPDNVPGASYVVDTRDAKIDACKAVSKPVKGCVVPMILFSVAMGAAFIMGAKKTGRLV